MGHSTMTRVTAPVPVTTQGPAVLHDGPLDDNKADVLSVESPTNRASGMNLAALQTQPATTSTCVSSSDPQPRKEYGDVNVDLRDGACEANTQSASNQAEVCVTT